MNQQNQHLETLLWELQRFTKSQLPGAHRKPHPMRETRKFVRSPTPSCHSLDSPSNWRIYIRENISRTNVVSRNLAPSYSSLIQNRQFSPDLQSRASYDSILYRKWGIIFIVVLKIRQFNFVRQCCIVCFRTDSVLSALDHYSKRNREWKSNYLLFFFIEILTTDISKPSMSGGNYLYNRLSIFTGQSKYK
jgi:hypothetical protein